MDFSYLLELASKNEEYAKEAAQIKRYSTQVSASKKEPRSAVQSQAIRNFLAKKDHEEKQKKLEELKKKEKLLALRAQDRKSNARVQAMLKRTKAANKAVLDEVKNSLHTAVTAAGLDKQPDEDDYGYVSQEASELYKKLLNKYSSDPSPNVSKQKGKSQKELSRTKDRVKDALHKTEEEEASTHRRRKRPAHKSASVDDLSEKVQKPNVSAGKEAPQKSKPKAPPPEAALSFDQILQLAAVKQHQPVVIKPVEKKVETSEKDGFESERLMTKKEREEFVKRKQEERDRQLRREGKLAPTAPSQQQKTKSEEKTTSKTPSLSTPSTKPTNVIKPVNGAVTAPVAKVTPAKATSPQQTVASKPTGTVSKSTGQALKPPSRPESKKTLPPVKPAANPGPPLGKCPPPRVQQQPTSKGPLVNKGKALATSSGIRPFPPYRDIRPVDRTYKRQIVESDEEEEDSDLDDFIDDGPDGTEDYSRHIKEIFGYDRSKYRRIESDDDECMESSFAQQMKEEKISTKIGILEDLEQERLLREEEERKKKRMANHTKRK